MTKPFQHVLGLIPKGVLAGLFVCPTWKELTLVVHGYRRFALVWRNGKDALSDQRPKVDFPL